MMHQKPNRGKLASNNLYDALERDRKLTCNQVRALLEDFVAAEQAGVEVDSDLRYSLLLEHLDDCDECMSIYQELSEAADLFDSERLEYNNAPESRVPNFFPPQLPSYILRLMNQHPRQVAIHLPVQHPVEWVGKLGSKHREATIFSGLLSELPEQPKLQVSARPYDDRYVSLTVQVQNKTGPQAWRFDLRAGEFQGSQTSDQNGSAIFQKIDLAALDALEITYHPVDAQAEDAA